MNFICDNCRQAADLMNPQLHNLCPGKTQCDCQHMADRQKTKG